MMIIIYMKIRKANLKKNNNTKYDEMENSKEISKTDRGTFNSIGYTDCTKAERKNKASLGERFTPIVLFYAFIIQLLLVFAAEKPSKKELRAVEGEIRGKEQKHRHHIFPINGWPFSS